MNTQEQIETANATPEERVKEWANRHEISAKFDFVPFYLSRSAGQENPSLNWEVTLYKNGREFLCFDYSAGMAHAPSYKQNMKYQIEVDAVRRECETGRKSTVLMSCNVASGKKIDPPKLADIFYSLSSDADALNYSTFEEWASSFGYETDSRKAEVIYKTCMNYALKLRGAVGEKGLSELQGAVSGM